MSAADGTDRPSRGFRLAAFLGVHESGRALRNFATYLPAQVVPALAGFLALPILARRLAPTEIGVLALAQTLVTLGWAISGNWLAAAVIRELPAARARNEVGGFTGALRLGFLVSGAAFAVLVLLLGVAGRLSDAIASTWPWVAAAGAGLLLQNVGISLLAADARVRAYALVEGTARVGAIGLGIAAVFQGYGISGYLAGLAVGSLVLGGIGLAFAWPRGGGSGETRHLRAWLHYGIPASVASISFWMLSFIDRYILAALRTTKDVGVYTVGNVVGDRFLAMPVFALVAVTVPIAVATYERDGRDAVEALVRGYTRLTLLIGAASIAYVAVTAPTVIPALTGITYSGDYVAAGRVAPVVAVATLLFGLANFGGIGLALARSTRPLAVAGVIGVVVNVLANLILIPPFGIMGAAVATPIGTAAYLAMVVNSGRKHVRWRFPWPTATRSLVAGAVGYIAARASMQIGGSVSADAAIAALAGAMSYVATLALLGERRAAA